MSVSSSAPSTHTSPSSWGLNDRLISLMESIYAIIAGLSLRYVVDTVSRHDFKITGTLVGLWEGVILLHFLKKLPKSTDPYLAFAVRLFIDFVVTESISRLVLVLTWTGMGMILADVAPAIWEDIGLRRVWRRFRRDLYIISESVPTVVFFPPTRTVRFSPSREPSVIAEEEEEEEPNPDAHTEARSVESSTSAALTEQDTSANIEPSVRRRLPGYFPGMLSDTESVLSSVLSRDIRLPSTLQRDSERTSRRLSVYPITTPDHDFASETSSQHNEEDEIKLSSSTSSQSTVTGPADTTRFTDDIRITEDFDTTQLTDIPDEVLEEQKPAGTIKIETVKKDLHPEEETALKPPNVTLFLPPTPSDSQPPHRRRLPKDDQPRPASASIPQIPDMPEESPSDVPSDGWEKIQKEDATDAEFPWEQVHREDAVVADGPPPLPPKDRLDMSHLEPFLAPTSTSTYDRTGLEGTTDDEHRYSQPPPYLDHLDDHDDIYEDHPSDARVSGAVGAGPSNLPDSSTLGDKRHIDEMWINEWLEQDVTDRRRQEEAEQQRKGEEAERKRAEEAAAEQKRQEEEQHEEAEKKRLEERAAEHARKEEEKRRQKEAAEQRRRDEEARKKLEVEEAEKKREEEKQKRLAELEKERIEAAAQRRKEEELEKRRKEEEEEKWRREEELEKWRREEELEKRRKEEEEEKWRREEELEKRRREEEEEKRRREEELEKRRREEELEKRRKEEEEEKRRREEELEKRRKEEEEEKRHREEEEEKRLKEEEEEEEKRCKEEELEKRRKEEEEEKRHREEEEEKRRKEEEEEKRRREEVLEKRRREEELEKWRREEEEEKRRKEEELEKRRKEQEAEVKNKDEAKESKRLEEEAKEQRRKDETAVGEEGAEAEKPKVQETAGNRKSEDASLEEEENKKLQAAPQSSQPAETVPTPSTSALAGIQRADGLKSAETVEKGSQANEKAGNDESDGGEQHRMETESVATDQSTIPADVESRLSRILLTKAQIVEIQSRIQALGAGLDATDKEETKHDLQRAQRVLEKLRKKDQRRRDEVPLQLGPGLSDREDQIFLQTYGQDDTKTRLLEKLEELLSPEATSLVLTVDSGKTGKRQKQQQQKAVTEVLAKFKLLDKSRAQGRQTIIDVPPDLFSEWLTEYRISITQPDDTEV